MWSPCQPYFKRLSPITYSTRFRPQPTFTLIFLQGASAPSVALITHTFCYSSNLFLFVRLLPNQLYYQTRAAPFRTPKSSGKLSLPSGYQLPPVAPLCPLQTGYHAHKLATMPSQGSFPPAPFSTANRYLYGSPS